MQAQCIPGLKLNRRRHKCLCAQIPNFENSAKPRKDNVWYMLRTLVDSYESKGERAGSGLEGSGRQGSGRQGQRPAGGAEGGHSGAFSAMRASSAAAFSAAAASQPRAHTVSFSLPEGSVGESSALSRPFLHFGRCCLPDSDGVYMTLEMMLGRNAEDSGIMTISIHSLLKESVYSSTDNSDCVGSDVYLLNL